MNFKELVRDIPDFPIPGVLFRDISPILESPKVFHAALDGFASLIDLHEIDHIVGIESRGFILGAALAARFEKGFVPLRKAGKLPPPVQSLSYELEYGKATLEIRPGHGNVLVIDDVLATGGTLDAGIKLCERAGYHVESVCVLINLTFLNQMKFRGKDIPALIHY
ncbi:MAG TPA: adenine phosphoribosyltransferase [Bdellovibrionales bacterium]|jgi:adenine phosphoribosyltransferase|nr:adenine phosphoribosyltransferase [Bdellovibrionales bacterium]